MVVVVGDEPADDVDVLKYADVGVTSDGGVCFVSWDCETVSMVGRVGIEMGETVLEPVTEGLVGPEFGMPSSKLALRTLDGLPAFLCPIGLGLLLRLR